MVDSNLLKKALIDEIKKKEWGWKLEKGDAGKMLDLIVIAAQFLVDNAEVTVQTPQGPGSGVIK